MSPTFAFDSSSQRFRYTSGARNGEYVSQAKIKDIVDREYIRSQKAVLGAIGDRLISGELELADWEVEVSQALKTLHINSYTLGKGGIERLTPRDYGTIGAKVKREYAYLRNFTNDVATGEMSIAQFQNRLSMYADTAFSTYQQARVISHRSDGFEWYRNIRNASESCSECISISAQGWQQVGTLVAIGARKCKGGDRCNWEFAKGDKPEETNRFITDFYAGWIGGLALEQEEEREPIS
jgi:hypothetical protein